MDLEIKQIGEQNFKTEFKNKGKIKTMEDLRNKYNNVIFESSSITTEQCKQFYNDLKKVLKNILGSEYTIKISLGHFYISGFIEKNNKFVYFSIEDLRENGEEFSHILYRTAKDNKDYTGGTNRFCELNKLAENISVIQEVKEDVEEIKKKKKKSTL